MNNGIRHAVRQKEGASILLLPVSHFIPPLPISSRSSFASREFLHEFKALDFPNGVRVVASFVLLLLQSKGLESRVITKRGDLIAATERADGQTSVRWPHTSKHLNPSG